MLALEGSYGSPWRLPSTVLYRSAERMNSPGIHWIRPGDGMQGFNRWSDGYTQDLTHAWTLIELGAMYRNRIEQRRSHLI